jgi:hypothetical protein
VKKGGYGEPLYVFQSDVPVTVFQKRCSWLSYHQISLMASEKISSVPSAGSGLDGDTKQKNKDKKNLESCGGFQYIYPKQRYI